MSQMTVGTDVQSVQQVLGDLVGVLVEKEQDGAASRQHNQPLGHFERGYGTQHFDLAAAAAPGGTHMEMGINSHREVIRDAASRVISMSMQWKHLSGERLHSDSMPETLARSSLTISCAAR